VADIDRALAKLRKASERVSRLDADREDAMRERNEAIKAAAAVKATYVQMQEAAGISQVTIAKVLRPSKGRA
jgi:hypothetical protein